MSNTSNLNSVLHDLKSEKVKERQRGIATLRTVFTDDQLVLNFDKKGTGEAWLAVFQALYATVGLEKTTYTKYTTKSAGSGAAAERRLSDAAATVRWLTERSVQRMNKAVVRSLFMHLLQMMVHNGELLSPVALDYIKALRCVVSWAPHLDHLNEETWMRITEMAFNVILGDPVRNPLDDDGDDQGGRGEDSLTFGTDLDDSEFYMDDDFDGRAGSVVSTDSQSKKRRRLDPSSSSRPPPRSFPSNPQSKSKISRSVSLEQIEFTSLLTILLQSPSAPFLSPNLPNLASAILHRLHRFLELYPADTSLHHDYLLALSATLSQLALNKRYYVEKFAHGIWDGLVRLWGTKNKALKEGLVVVLLVLFPYFTADQDRTFTWAEGVGRLWHLLEGEAESRWGADGLSYDSLKLEAFNEEGEDMSERPTFATRTFRAGWHFDAGQALAWAILELQADCADKLFQASESMHLSTAGMKGKGKRPRFENPVASLLHSIQSQSSSTIRTYHLQILLFFVTRHWFTLHRSQQQDIIDALVKLVSFEDVVTQSWTFLCLAAIADADNSPGNPLGSSSIDRTRDTAIWDPIWTHAIRRANSPGVCRAACHVACILLSRARRFLTSQRVLLEIESLAKDLDVQGPTFPYDSVCVFFSQCLKVASQNVRLYHMQLEEKVLGWLVDSWKVGDNQTVQGKGGRCRMEPHMVGDVLLLLESICGFSKRYNLVSRILLPDCSIVDAMLDQGKTTVIREFQLHGRLPPFHKPREDRALSVDITSSAVRAMKSADLAPPRGRERRVSTFIQRSLEVFISGFDAIKHANGHSTAERVRQALDLAVTALLFESLLVLNGTLSTRRVIQCACKLVTLAISLLTNSMWTTEEKALILLGLEPLIFQGNEGRDDDSWVAMLSPDADAGVRSQTLRKLVSNGTNERSHQQFMRRDLQRILFLSPDVQDASSTVMHTLRNLLRVVVGQKPDDSAFVHSIEVEDRDSFGPIRTIQPSPKARQQKSDSAAYHCIAEVSMAFLVVVPVLQSASGDPIRDKELTEFVLSSDDNFRLVASLFFDNVGRRLLKLSVTNLDNFLQKIGALLGQYKYSRCEKLQLFVCHFLGSTLHLWLHDSANGDVGEHLRTLCHWLSNMLKDNKIRSWKLRDGIARFLDKYLTHDPNQTVWSRGASEFQDMSPAELLPMLGADEDIRVRFRAAVANARLFSVARTIGEDALQLYDNIKKCLTTDLYDHERMITRLLSLGNIMVASSEVRRGPYWHALEISLYASAYSRHIEAVLVGVSERLGLTSFSMLFEAYASQIAFSIRRAGRDFLQFPPHLLGFRDRKECAEVMLRAFTPTNLIAGGTPQDIDHGRTLFENHCENIEKSTEDGIRECFGDIVGLQIATWMDVEAEAEVDSEVLTEELDKRLKHVTMFTNRPGDFDDILRQNIDGVVAAILRTFGDQDISPDGAIILALRRFDNTGSSAQAFQELTRYRKVDDFRTHSPNLPFFSAEVVLRALLWLKGRVPEAEARATIYHVLHELLADVRHSLLVNEQMRLLNGITLCVACHHDDFEEPTLLHTLMHGATSLLEQSDLARAAQSLLGWAFGRYRKIGQKDPRFPDLLIRICCLAYNYSLDRESAVARVGNELLQWIDGQAFSLCKNAGLRHQVVRTLPAWPHKPSPELMQLYHDISSESLSALLSDHRISSNKFRLVKRLRDLALEKKYSEEKFAQTDFWRLKECIPPLDQLQDDDILAFASLLVLNKGHVHNVRSELTDSQSGLARYLRDSRKRSPSVPEGSFSPQHTIVVALLSILNGSVTAHVHVAYRTLRLLMSAPNSEIPQSQSWPPANREELEYLQAYRRTPGVPQLRDMSELSTADSCHDAAMVFPEWITMITTLLCDILARTDVFWVHLTSILKSDITFASQILPVLVHCVLQVETQDREDLSYRRLLSNYFTSILTSGTVSSSCLRSIIDTVLYLRHFTRLSVNDALSYDKWLDIDFTLLARNAITCGAYTTSLLFLELAAEYPGSSGSNDSCEKILFDIYSHIDEPDGFYGINTKDLTQFLLKRFHHEKQWEKAFRFHGAALEAGGHTSSADAEGLLQSFHSFGFNQLAMDAFHNRSAFATGSIPGSSGMSYRLGWRTETWDLPDQTEGYNPGASLYHAIRAIHRERDPYAINIIVRRALFSEMERLQTLGTENLVEIREVTQNLMCLSQVAQWMDSSIQTQLRSKQDANGWTDFINIEPDFNFSDLESILATRISLLRAAKQKAERDQIGNLLTPFARGLIDIEKKCLVRLSEAARAAGQVQIALNSIIRSQQLEKVPTFEVSQEFSSVLWLQNEEKLAVQYLSQLVTEVDSDDDTGKSKKGALLARLGTWTSEACLKKPTDILTQFFHPATSLVASIDSTKSTNSTCAMVYHQCAIFAERQYHAILKSPDAIRWKMYGDRKVQELKKRQEHISKQVYKKQVDSKERKDLESEQRKAQILLSQDQQLLERHTGARDAFLAQAIGMYSRCLEISDDFDDDGTIRLCSLWFSNFDDVSLHEKVRDALDRVPSRKFVFLAHQISARLSKSVTAETPKHQENLQKLVVRMCEEHPFHSLYQVYCLLPQRPASSPTISRQSSRHDVSTSQSERGAAASDIFDRLRGDASRGERVRDLERTCDAFVEWAQHPIKDNPHYQNRRGKTMKIPEELRIRKVQKVQVPVVSVDTPLDYTLRYDNCVWIERYEDTFEPAGGLNVPKISICHGSDGEKYKQLFKGEGGDDLRQDAVMEQVFGLVNIVLRRDRETRRRNLRVRRYKVVPLCSQAGVLEYVGNTCPLMAWLQGAHLRYRPYDLKPKSASEQLKLKSKECNHRTEPLLALFLDIRAKLKPVMRHYFTERSKNPISWFSMRLNYTRSVATTSIVGHILGLGDRHSSNILMDNVTGEVIHIDFGVAFDQGKLLSVPERIPFRMTADIVDGMGISGTQGVFQRCAEETLRVLRDDSEVIMTVLEVFKHDPLHSWTANELKIKRVQGTPLESTANDAVRLGIIGIDMTSGGAEEAADRALTSVARKLNKALSVEYTVNELIAEATDLTNLATLYFGWGAHL